MNPEELKKLLEDAVAQGRKVKEQNEALEKQVQKKADELEDLVGKFNAFKQQMTDGGGEKVDPEEVKKLTDSMNDLLDEVSDLRTKMKTPNQVVTPEQKQAMHDAVIKPVIGKWLKGKTENTPVELFKFVEQAGAEQFKALNITNADEGGRAVAEILSRDVIEYAREYSPMLGEVGRKPSMTRNFRELVLVTYPSVQEGIENVAGVVIAETTTQEYKEVKSKEFKVNAKPRITDEAMYGADIDLYGDLIRLLGREVAIYLAAQVLYGDGTGKNARGVLSSNRVDITNLTGESFKPTLAADPANARGADFFPVLATGVSGSLGADDVAIVNYIIDLTNTLPTQWLAGAKFYMNRKTKGVLQKVRDADNKPIFMGSYMDGGVMMLMGYPVVIDDTLPDLAADSTPIIFGNLMAAFAINDGDIDKMLIDPYTVDECTVVKYSKEMFEIMQNSDAILVCAATANAGA